jgi:arylsulfatase I/J
MAEHMLRAGYQTHMYGKWDVGMATPDHTPHGRGYQSSLHYFHHANDYWTSKTGTCGEKPNKVGIVDLWDTDKPAHGKNNTPSCSQKNQDGCVYEDQLFADAVVSAIKGRDKKKPFFIFWAPHIVHTPLQVPQAHLDHFSFIKESHRQFYHAMVHFVDEAIGNVTQLLRSEGLWDDTLVVLHADNGGPIYNSGNAGANNYPLKGGKMSNWEGGIRVNAFATGGFLPKAVRGTKQEGLMAGWDWYATYAALAGVDPTDKKAEAAGLPPHDSHNLWPLLSGQTDVSPRTELAVGAEHEVGGLIAGKWKVVLGDNAMAGWAGKVFPNTTSDWNPSDSHEKCGNTTETGCLYNILEDPGEHVNLAAEKPKVFNRMITRIAEINKGFFDPVRGQTDPRACELALTKYGGFWGPFVDVESTSVIV